VYKVNTNVINFSVMGVF